MVDQGKMAFNHAVALSYLSVLEQKRVIPSSLQAIRLKHLSQEEQLDRDVTTELLAENKPNQRQITYVNKKAPLSPKGDKGAVLPLKKACSTYLRGFLIAACCVHVRLFVMTLYFAVQRVVPDTIKSALRIAFSRSLIRTSYSFDGR